MQDKVKALIRSAFDVPQNIEVAVPKNEKYGDYATNIAISLAKKTSSDPKTLASELASRFRSLDRGLFSSIVPTDQGFINFRLSDKAVHSALLNVLKRKEKYGAVDIGKNKRVLLEFVSANPTGPLHIGHGRWAVIGDCLANILRSAGYKVDSEFYVNDAGEQIEKLVNSILARMEGKTIPEDGYAGHYVAELADKLKGKGMARERIKSASLNALLGEQKSTLSSLGVKFDNWFFETSLHKKKLINNIVNELTKRGLTFREEGALWFRSSQYGDDKNRVLIKDGGNPTYFAADIAYHVNKFKRGYKKLINVWGTDHHGYVARLRSALTALGLPSDSLEVIIGQLVALYRGKELVRMSKRTGDMITLQEVIDEIGKDAARYYLVKNSPNTHLDFDLELAKSKSMENPVYYVSYAHARICSILNEAKSRGLYPSIRADLSRLSSPEERSLLLKLLRYEDEVATSAALMQPHRLTAYAEELAWIFHNYYHKYRVISDDQNTSIARLTLVLAASIVLKNVLKLLGISAPEKM